MDENSTPFEIIINEVEVLGENPPKPLKPNLVGIVDPNKPVPINLFYYAHWLPAYHCLVMGVEIQNGGNLPPFQRRQSESSRDSKLDLIRSGIYWLERESGRAREHYKEHSQAAQNHTPDNPDDWRCPDCGLFNYQNHDQCNDCAHPKPVLSVDDNGIRWNCPTCAVSNKAEDTTCRHCGYDLDNINTGL